MASKSKLGHVVVIVALCALLLIAAASGRLSVFSVRVFCGNQFFTASVLAGCKTGHHGCTSAKAGSFLKDSRKILRTFERDGGSKIANEELRGVPSGPDPLHHHKGSPQRPQTP
ncbi:hypothetical protein BT93_J0562 [Corymbia citriodora subsp. variegata]|nr:hypothetical protein BT93_J0562 [Corymbia citriodora subsp. variegata]